MENQGPQISTPIERVGSEVWKRFKRSKFIWVFFFVLIFGLSILQVEFSAGILIIYFTFFISVPTFIGILLYHRFKVMREFLGQFAAANGYEFRARGNDEDAEKFIGALADHRGSLSNLIIGKYGDHPLSIFTHTYTVSSGKHTQTIVHTVFELTILSDLPNIFLLTRWFFGGFRVRSSKGTLKFTSHPKEVPLGGNFDKVFRLYAPEDYEVEALQIFTYPILEELEKAYNKIGDFALEFVENKLYVYIRGEITNAKKLKGVYSLCGILLAEVSPIVKRMNRMLNAQEETLTRLNQIN